jgi:hypothetical protein
VDGALHDLNNVLTALHLALHLAQSKVGGLPEGIEDRDTRDGVVSESDKVAVQLRRSVHLVDRAGQLAQTLRRAWEDDGSSPS